MKSFWNVSSAGAQVPSWSMARDVARIVITAVLAGTGFAVLLALAVLSLTVIAPPAHASGGPVTGASDSSQKIPTASAMPSEQSGGSVQQQALAAPPVPAQVAPAGSNEGPARSSEGKFTSLPGMVANGGWMLILALMAGATALIVYLRRKA